MFVTDFPRDLLTTAALFGLASFVWAGWAQEKPPSVLSRVYLAALGLGGLVVMGLTIPTIIKNWRTPTAIEFGGPAWNVYIVMVAVEFAVAIIGAIVLARRGRGELIAPFILLIVGVHFAPLAPVFGQPFLYVVAALVTIIAVGILIRRPVSPSYWCGALAAPVFLVAAGIAGTLGRVAV